MAKTPLDLSRDAAEWKKATCLQEIIIVCSAAQHSTHKQVDLLTETPGKKKFFELELTDMITIQYINADTALLVGGEGGRFQCEYL